MPSARDHAFMARALALARRGLYGTHPNPRVGCVIARDGAEVAAGWHRRAGGPHAEIAALRAAGERARGATAYVTLEPCCHHGRTPPCSEALLEAGVARVVAAMPDPNPRVAGQGLERLRAAGVRVEVGLMEDRARALNEGYVRRMGGGPPAVRCKLAMSLDGRTAMASGESRWITGPEARADVQRLRAASSAIVTGAATVLADDPSLNVRLAPGDGPLRQPLRVILDPALRTPPAARTLGLEGEVLVLTAADAPERRARLEAAGARVMAVPAAAGGLDLAAALQALAALEVNEVHLECGPRLAGAFLQAGLIDELVLYVAPHLMGGAARPLIELPEIATMEQRLPLAIHDLRAVGADWRITVRPVRG